MGTFNGICYNCGEPTSKTPTGRHKKYCDPCDYEISLEIKRAAARKYHRKTYKKVAKRKMVLKCPIGAISLSDAILKGVQCIPCQKLFRRVAI